MKNERIVNKSEKSPIINDGNFVAKDAIGVITIKRSNKMNTIELKSNIKKNK